MQYRVPGLSFEIPEGLVDQSMIVLVDGERAALTVAREPLDGTLGAYVDAVVDELTTSMAGYHLDARGARTIAARAALVLEHRATPPGGQPVQQRQAYVEVGATVVIVTVTSPPHADEHGRALFERVLTSLAIE